MEGLSTLDALRLSIFNQLSSFALTPGPNVPEILPAVRCNVVVAVDHHGYPLVENVQNHLPWRVGGHESLIQVPCEVLEPLNFHQTLIK